MDLSKPKTWRDLKKEDIICVSDPQTLSGLITAGESAVEQDMVIERIVRFVSDEGGMEYLFFEFDSDIVIVAILLDDDVVVRAYFVSSDPNPGTRDNILNVQNCGWLFVAPENEDDFNIEELDYAVAFDQEDESAGGKINYSQEGGYIEGTIDGDFATLQEYVADGGINPRVILREVGEEEGYIVFLQGCDIGLNDLSLLRG